MQEDLDDLGERAVLAVRQLRRPDLAQDRAFAVQPLDKRLEFGLVQGSGFRVLGLGFRVLALLFSRLITVLNSAWFRV